MEHVITVLEVLPHLISGNNSATARMIAIQFTLEVLHERCSNSMGLYQCVSEMTVSSSSDIFIQVTLTMCIAVIPLNYSTASL